MNTHDLIASTALTQLELNAYVHAHYVTGCTHAQNKLCTQGCGQRLRTELDAQ